MRKMYQMAGEKQQHFDENQLTCGNIKKQILEDINWENKRTNVDSSKKRAVM